jgi:mono/diheme cytochrome c family protein
MRRFFFLVFAASLATGCGGSKDKPVQSGTSSPPSQGQMAGSNQTANTDTGPKSPGVVAFETANCTNCHATVGAPKTGNGRGPDLSKVGAKREKDWIIAHVRDPKSHNPMSRMPASGPDKLSDQDAGTIGEYLAGLK